MQAKNIIQLAKATKDALGQPNVSHEPQLALEHSGRLAAGFDVIVGSIVDMHSCGESGGKAPFNPLESP